MDAKLTELTLENLANGGLKERFEQVLGDLRLILQSLPEYQYDGNGQVHAKVKIDLDFALSEKGLSVVASCDLAPPKRIAISGAVFHQRGKFTIWENEPQQEPLPLRPRAVGKDEA